MAIYSLHTTPASRSSGKNAIAMAAYRSGERLIDLQTGQVCDYTRKRGILEKNILFPQGVIFERQELWNMAEQSEKRKDGRIAREILIALPHELEPEARLNLVKEYAQELVDKYQIAVDFSIHAPNEKGDDRNFHAHLMLTTRQISQYGLSEKSELERSDKYLKQHGLKNGKEQIFELREEWEERCNLALKREGIEEQISAKSYRARNIEQEPTIHLGPAASEMERRGIETEKGVRNRIIRKRNKILALYRRRIALQCVYRKIAKKTHQLENEIKIENEEKRKKGLLSQKIDNIIQDSVTTKEKEILIEIKRPQEKIKSIDASKLLNEIAQQNKIEKQEKALNATNLLKYHKTSIEEEVFNSEKKRKQISSDNLLKLYAQNEDQQTHETQLTAQEVLDRNEELDRTGQDRYKGGIER